MLKADQLLRFIALLIFSSAFSLSFASSADDLANLLQSINSMQANFEQTVYDQNGKEIQRSFGRMVLLKPGKLRWEVIKPIPQLVIAKEPKLWIFDPDLEQVTIKPLHRVTNETPALLLSHPKQVLNKDYQVKQIGKDTQQLSFELQPKNSNNIFTSIELSFRKGQIYYMRLKDHLGHITLINYQNIQTNKKIAESLFVFNPSPHIDVIDETKRN